MPLIIEGRTMHPPSSVNDFIQSYPQYQIESRHIRSIPPIAVNPQEPYLFVHQMESACVSSEDPSIHMIGIDGITTCCCAIIRHTGSCAMGAGHFDGNDTKDGLERIVNGVVELTNDWTRRNNINQTKLLAEYQYEIFLIGGFDDARDISQDVVMQLFENLCESNLEIHLKTACICATNTYFEDNIPYPCITGLLCNIKTGQISPAAFSFQGPLEEIRRLRFAMRPPIIMHSVYDPFARILEIKPYDWTLTNDTIQQLLGLNTNSFLHYWSTSPLAEKPTFVSACKIALKFLKDNRASLFCSGPDINMYGRIYTKQMLWTMAGCAVACSPFAVQAVFPFYRNMSPHPDKTVVITGGTGNLAKALTFQLALRKVRIILACRDVEKCKSVRREIVLKTGHKGILCRYVDLEDIDSMSKFVDDITKTEPHIDVLVNNAAVTNVYKKELTKYGIEKNYFVNFLAPFFLTFSLYDKLKETAAITKDARIINIIGKPKKSWKIDLDDINFDKRTYRAKAAYRQSKLALAYFTILLDKFNKETRNHIKVYGTNPGTHKILRNPDAQISFFKEIINGLRAFYSPSPDKIIMNVVMCALDPELARPECTGKLYSYNLSAILGWGFAGKRENDAKLVWNAAKRTLLELK